MANKKSKENKVDTSVDMDDMEDLDMEGMDFGDLENVEDDRNPSKPAIAKELAEEAGKGFFDSLVTNTAKKSLPEEYTSYGPEMMDYANFAKETFDENASKVNNSLYKFGKEVKKILPFQIGLLNKYLESKESEYETAREESKEEQQEASIQSNLTSIFDKQIEIQKAIEAKRDASDEVETRERITTNKLNYNVLANIDSNVANQTAFTMQISKEYYRKSLELQFKSFYIQSDMLKTMKDYYKGFSIQFDDIVKNTGLPEFVKLNSNERVQEVIRTQATQNLYKTLFSNNKYVENVKKKMSSLISSKVSGVTEKINDVTSQLSMMNDATGGGTGALKLLAGAGSGMLGGTLGEKLADKISPKLRDRIKDNATINTGANYLSMLANSPSTFFSMLRNKSDRARDNYSDEATPTRMLMSKIFGATSGLLGVTDPESMNYQVKGSSLLDHAKPAIFDNKVHRSITEVIPMYLAKILKENTDLRTMYSVVNQKRIKGVSGSDELVYNYDERSLSTAGDYQNYVQNKYITSTSSKNKVANVSGNLINASLGELSKDKAANKDAIGKLRSKQSEKLLQSYLDRASQIEGISYDFKTLVEDASEGTAPMQLQQLIQSDPKLQELLDVLKKSTSKDASKLIDTKMSDVKRVYPVSGLKELFKGASIIAGSKVYNLLKDDQAEILARGITKFLVTGKDMTMENILNFQVFTHLTPQELKKVSDPCNVFISDVRKIKSLDQELQTSSLGVLIGAVNTSLRQNADIDPNVFQVIYDASPVLGKQGQLSVENLFERKLFTGPQGEVTTMETIRDTFKISKQEVDNIRKKVIGEELSSSVDKYFGGIKKELDDAKGNPFAIARLLITKVKDAGNSAREAAKSSYSKYSKDLDSLKESISNLKEETIDKSVDLLITKLQTTEANIDSMIKSQTELKDKELQALNEAKSKLVETVRDPAGLNDIDKSIKSTTKYFDSSIKTLTSLKSTLSSQRANITRLKSEGLPNKSELIKRVRDEVFSTLDKVKQLLDTSKKEEANIAAA